jgi:ribosomal protein S27AE
MRFLNPVAVTCSNCGRPTVIAETSTGSVRVHCGTWRWQCDIPSTAIPHADRSTVIPAGLTTLDPASDHKLAA